VPPPHSSYDEGTYSQRDPRGGYRDEYDDRENYSNRGARDHDPNRRRLAPSEPSPHVIFLGLDPDFTEADVSVTYYEG
jgi:RNA-binding protein 5/10